MVRDAMRRIAPRQEGLIISQRFNKKAGLSPLSHCVALKSFSAG